MSMVFAKMSKLDKASRSVSSDTQIPLVSFNANITHKQFYTLYFFKYSDT